MQYDCVSYGVLDKEERKRKLFAFFYFLCVGDCGAAWSWLSVLGWVLAVGVGCLCVGVGWMWERGGWRVEGGLGRRVRLVYLHCRFRKIRL